MKLVVGLGNPGRRYNGTRHNVGFFVIRELAKRYRVPSFKTRFEAEFADTRIGEQRAFLLTPQTFMNASGRSVRACVDYFDIPSHNVLVLCDDMNLLLGQVRFRPAGSSGGQKGLQDVIGHLGTEAVPRGRIGIGRPPSQMSPTAFVLSRFRDDEEDAVEEAVKRAADGVELWIAEGVEAAMNRINGLPLPQSGNSP